MTGGFGGWLPIPGGGGSLDGLSDVDTSTTAPTTGQALVYDSTSGLWKPGTVSGGGSSAETPETVNGLVCWVDADHFATDNTIPLRALADRSPLSTALVGSGATFKTGAFGTEPAVNWTVAGLYESRMAAGWKPFTAVAVISVSSLAAGRTIFGSGVASTGFQWRINTTGTQQLNEQSVAGIGTSSTALAVNIPYLIGVTYSPTGAYAFRRNGAADGSGTTNRSPAAGTVAVGALAANSEPFLGDIGAFLLYNRVLTATELDNVEAYLAARYGIAI